LKKEVDHDLKKEVDHDLKKEVDHDLKQTLPLVFTKKLLRKMDSSELSQKLDIWLYHYFSDRFGVMDNVDHDTARSKGSGRQFRHRGLERLRRKKNELRKAYKTLCKKRPIAFECSKIASHSMEISYAST
jgi:hypothetical protein